MNSGFINRLVGTSIVVIAAIVFIPNILDGEKVHYKEGFKAIPDRPEFKTIDLQEAINDQVANAQQPTAEAEEDISADDELLTSAAEVAVESTSAEQVMVEASTEQEAVVAKAQPVEKQPEPARKPEENLSKMAYVIQLGSFSHAANVKSLQAKLSDKGFKTFTRPVKTPNGTLTKVFVGPSLNKAELESKLPELKALTKLNGKVTQFEVTK
ncbi:SPOR domain-containing protein [Pseudoalteromonas haloplanktis]|uniref:SPOR domain-containing protein n=1 Tax=Pseudoalteromonas haloplanktis TaxID=228 RepID=A0ABU1BBI2_PSEHA|nr:MULTISPECIES: SPOR domain-containing protein [Pseudoalteromonas]MDQ9091284.1 SPOR domain-containing protein [Pseudoalteromonas haloplanktis]TMN72084.1 DedD protein [Pseudoalteromonas sp. S1727]BDF93690.1 sporulation protein [Pseudoalteromonas sp. KAN5]